MSYHKNIIPRGEWGEFSKIKEEFLELEDGFEQDDKILQIVELADLLGAIEGYANTLNVSLDDLINFKEKTAEAFRSGYRKPRA